MDENAGAGPLLARLDPARLSEISGGDPGFEQELAGEYLAQSWQLFEIITRSLESHDTDGLRRAAHTLKGSSRTIGAEGVASLASELEALTAPTTRDTAPLASLLMRCITATERELDRYFGTDRYRKAA